MNLDHKYNHLMQRILDEGVLKQDRTGTGTKSIFGTSIEHNIMKDGFPLLTTKKLHFKSIAHELLWFLKGDTNTKYLTDNGVTIWNEWADANGNLGNIYGKQWVDWNGKGGLISKGLNQNAEFVYDKGINQIQYIIDQLKTNPDNRRLLVSAWNVGELDKMALPPCHYSFQFYTRELSVNERAKLLSDKLNKEIIKTSLHGEGQFEMEVTKDADAFGVPKRAISILFNMRSCDTFLGLPYNIASYALLLSMVGHCVNMIPERVVGNLGDTHLYLNHFDQAKEQISRDCYKYKLPTLKINTQETDIFKIKYEDFVLENYQAFPSIKAPIAI